MDSPADTPPPPPPPLTFFGWLAQNGAYLLFLALLVVGVYQFAGGAEGVWKAAIAVLGLGFIIFIHELGHFVAAKWCDVHVQTFSIGFGPALPGCSFVWGETLYKIAVIPLGGYVAMVGEGPEADEGDDYPRSFKNKTVAQRMLIISAGVVMNVLLGCLCFIIVYSFHGVERRTAIVDKVDPGSPAWTAGVRSGSVIVKIGSKEDPCFEDLKTAVAFGWRKPIDFEFKPREGDGPLLQTPITPRSEAGDMMPVIGVTSPSRLQFLSRKSEKYIVHPVRPHSAAAAARFLDLHPGETVLAFAVAGSDEWTDLNKSQWAEDLARRLPDLVDKELTLRVAEGAGNARLLAVPLGGFDFDDIVVATTDPATPADPFHLTDLPQDPNNPTDKDAHDPVEFDHRMRTLAGKPVAIRVKRQNEAKTLFVPPAFHRDFGIRMKMGEVAGVREGSPADKAGLKKTDVLAGVEVSWVDADGKEGPKKTIPLDDPTRLGFELRKASGEFGQHPAHAGNEPGPEGAARGKMLVTCTVLRPKDHETAVPSPLPPMAWDESWRFQDDFPISRSSPLSIPELGLAYRVESVVTRVVPGLVKDMDDLKEGDVVVSIGYKRVESRDKEPEWGPWNSLKSSRGYDEWGSEFFSIQIDLPREIRVKVKRDKEELERRLAFVIDDTWPVEERGFLFVPDTRLKRAANFLQAIRYGAEDVWNIIGNIYLSLGSMGKGDISPKSLGGPIEIGKRAFEFAEDPYTFLLFMGLISINLAVVNFLPIPVLDGGHMVFLIYEALRGKPPSDTVRAVATYLGLALILGLMLFVFYQDIMRIDWVARRFGQ